MYFIPIVSLGIFNFLDFLINFCFPQTFPDQSISTTFPVFPGVWVPWYSSSPVHIYKTATEMIELRFTPMKTLPTDLLHYYWEGKMKEILFKYNS